MAGRRGPTGVGAQGMRALRFPRNLGDLAISVREDTGRGNPVSNPRPALGLPARPLVPPSVLAKSRVLEFAPAFWKQTLEQQDTQQRLTANVFRTATLVDHAAGVARPSNQVTTRKTERIRTGDSYR